MSVRSVSLVALSFTFVLFACALQAQEKQSSDDPFDSSQEGYPRWSAFTGYDWVDGKPMVQIDGDDSWYELVSFHGVAIEDIIKRCNQEGWQTKWRIRSDLVQIVRIMGHEIDLTAKFELRDSSGKLISKSEVPMREENLRLVEKSTTLTTPFVSSALDYPNWSAFTGFKWDKGKAMIQLPDDENWYELVSVHGVAIEDIIKKCEKEGWGIKKRVGEDLVQIIRLMGHDIDKTTTLKLRDGKGNVVSKTDVTMSADNLQRTIGVDPTAIVAAVPRSNPFVSSVQGYPKWSAFKDFKWEEGKPHVKIEGSDTWYELKQFHDIPMQDIIAKCEKESWATEHRICEDLVQIVRLMGHDIDKTTNYELVDPEGKTVTSMAVTMTEENQRLMEAAAAAMAIEPALPIQPNPFSSSLPNYPYWSPFTAMKREGEKVQVRIDESEVWYELVEFNSIPIEKMIEFCDENGYGDHRIIEDTVQVARLMGNQIDKTTDLKLRDQDGRLVTMDDVMMTEAKQIKVMKFAATANIKPLEPSLLIEDLKVFEKSLEQQFAYLNTNGVDYKSDIAALSVKASEGMSREQFAGELQKIIAKFVDGHASVSGRYDGFTRGYLPILIEPSGDRFVAIEFDRTEFIDNSHPYIGTIDGIEINRWLEATERYIAAGSPQLKVRRGLDMLNYLQHFREILGVELSEQVKLTLVSRDGKSSLTKTIDISQSPNRAQIWPPVRPTKILDGNIGYVRIPAMSQSNTELLRASMTKFRETDGVIIDVRGNGGGIRTPILELASYLVTEDSPPRIGNVAKYRKADYFLEDHLSQARYIYRRNSAKFDQRDRAQIDQFMQTFEPQWIPPEDEFSEWHFLVLSKNVLYQRYHYDKPVVILLDEHCFSATDIFLGTFKGWPGVTLIGQASGGGSARSQTFELPNSKISVRCASMASFQPSGKLYDGHGVEPNITVVRPPEYYRAGGPDAVLAKAIEFLKTR